MHTTGECTLGTGDSSGVCVGDTTGDTTGECTLGTGDSSGVCVGDTTGDTTGECTLGTGETTGDTFVRIFCGWHTTAEYLVWPPVSSLSGKVFFFSTVSNVKVPSTG